jgi:purine-nucleoside phosphorylase
MLARLDSVASSLRSRFGSPPDAVLVLGSGLGAFASAVEDPMEAAYAEVGIPAPSVAGHAGRVVVGRIAGRRVAVMSGRLHLYEGHDVSEVVLAARASARWGARHLVLTSAVGGVAPDLRTGDVVVVADHLNFLGRNPLTGPDIPELGPRFPDLARLYTPRLREIALACADAAAPSRVREGVYAAMPGPSYETPAEIRMLGRLGADVVGMSMVPEAIAAGHAGMDVLGLAVVSNPAAGLTHEELKHSDVTAAMNAAGARVCALLARIVAQL